MMEDTHWCYYRCATELRMRLSRCRIFTIFICVLIPILLFNTHIFYYYVIPYNLNYNVKVVVKDYDPTPGGRFGYNQSDPAMQLPGLWDENPVPNLVHYIMFGESLNLTFANYLSVLSAYKVQKPALIMLHCNNLPVGKWWERLWRDVPLRVMHRDPPLTIHGQTLQHVYHQGDIAKMQILQKYGGIYLDFDVIVINSLNPLRKYKVTMGKEKPPKLIAGIIVAEPNALFLRLLYESYRNNYWRLKWDYNCAIVAYKLYEKMPHLIHIEYFKLTTPDWTERELLYQNTINWRELYVLHLMWHSTTDRTSPEKIKTMVGTLGQVLRQTYYGDSRMIT